MTRFAARVGDVALVAAPVLSIWLAYHSQWAATAAVLVGFAAGHRHRARACALHERCAEQRGRDEGRRIGIQVERRRNGWLPPPRHVMPALARGNTRSLPHGAKSNNRNGTGGPQ